MAQKVFTDELLTASDVNTYLSGEGGQWTSWTPVIDQGASTNIAKTVNYSRYGRWGRMIVWNFTLSLTASGSAGSGITLTLPVTASTVTGLTGSGAILDASVQNYAGFWDGNSTTKIVFLAHAGTGAGVAWGGSPNVALASGDVLKGSITYEAAT